MQTRSAFVDAYRSQLLARYEWAKDEAKLARFMESVRTTLFGDKHTWHAEGVAFKEACKALGLKARTTVKALRALPAE